MAGLPARPLADAGVVGGGVPVHGDAVKGLGDHLAEHVLQEGPVNGAVGGDAAEHGAHVGVDHAGALGDGPDGDGFAPQFHGDGNLLHLQVSGEDGVGGVQGGLGGVRQSGDQGGNPLLNGLDVQLHTDDAGGADGEVLGPQAGGGSGGLGHPLGVLPALGGAGVGVAAVKNDPPGLVVGQVLLGEDHRVGLDHIAGIRARGSAGDGGEDHGQVLFVRLGCGEVVFDAAVDARGLKSLGGGDTAGDNVHNRKTSLVRMV